MLILHGFLKLISCGDDVLVLCSGVMSVGVEVGVEVGLGLWCFGLGSYRSPF